eukprot:s3193_g4.t1
MGHLYHGNLLVLTAWYSPAADHELRPSGWTDRVQTTNFVFCRLFGPDGQTHGSYDNKFLHEVFDSCPMGTTSYVLFGNKAGKSMILR